MDLLTLLADYPMLFVSVVAIFSLLVGSFLNVVIHRLPIMLDRAWRADAAAILEGPAPSGAKSILPEARYDLVAPRSACPSCNAPITALQNIPLLSYAFLRGKCAKCAVKISPRYPIVEAVTAVTSAIVAYKFGFTWYTAAGLIMTWSLISLFLIDFDTQLLPDQITLPLVWIGLLMSIYATPDSPFAPNMQSSIVGGAAGYLSLRIIYHAFKLITGKEGMGFGDFKLLAAFGTWFGWQPLLLIVLLSSFAGAAIGGAFIVFKGRDHNIPFAYGPYLALAGWVAMLWGDQLIGSYLAYSGLNR